MTESKKPSKQRKAFYAAKLHKRQNMLAGHLSEKLGKELGLRAIALRKGDKVRVMRGSHKKKEGKIVAVNHKKMQVSIENLVRKKADGTEIPLAFRASNLMVIELDRSDSRRMKRLNKQGKKPKEAGKTDEERKTGKGE